ncbi:MAG: Lrp/AsnC family transcriptional regulator [Gammaproteobacteria bacterium]|nr:MAG: Lrp/AsnC family transcriptional regulator [Gammaproteobacteria bacterium]
MEEIDRRIINRLQEGLPLVEAPYAAAAKELGISEEELLSRLRALLDSGVLSRFGPMFNPEALGGAFCLCAMAVPEEAYEEVAGMVNAFPEVAHNYRREHRFNMWFVLACETPGRIAQVLREIEERTGLPVLDLPKEREFYIGLRLCA